MKIKVSVATAAYNEEESIKQMLDSVCSQEEHNILIREILVVSDGSSDRTIEVAKNIGDKRIRVIDDGQRLGQPARIAQILQGFNGDVLILLDSDMIMADKWTVEKMVFEFIKNENVVFVGAHAKPLPAMTLLESAVNNYRYAREVLENDFSFNNSAYGAHACLAYRRDFAKSLVIPKDVMSIDSYSYFMCLEKDFEFAHAKEAIVWYRSPQNVKDQVNQATRHFAGRIQLYKYFSRELVDSGFYVPKEILLKIMLIQFVRAPFAYIFLKLINLYCIYRSKTLKNVFENRWVRVDSTKTVEVRN